MTTSLMSQEFINRHLMMVANHPGHVVEIDRTLLQTFLSELLVVRAAVKADEEQRLAAVKKMTIQATMAWAKGLVNDIITENIDTIEPSTLLEMVGHTFDEVNAQMSEIHEVGGNA